MLFNRFEYLVFCSLCEIILMRLLGLSLFGLALWYLYCINLLISTSALYSVVYIHLD